MLKLNYMNNHISNTHIQRQDQSLVKHIGKSRSNLQNFGTKLQSVNSKLI